MKIEGDPKNCGDCYFLFENEGCQRLVEPIRDIKVCVTGPMMKIPRTGEEMKKVFNLFEKRIRKEGDEEPVAPI